MRPALEYASSVWSPIAFSTSINKLQVMQNAALRTATGCTQDTNIQHLHDLPYHSHSPYTSTYSSTPHNTNRKHNIHHIPYTNTQHTSTLQGSNGRYTTNIPTDPHTVTTTDIKTNMRHIHTSIVSRHIATRGNIKILRTPPPHTSSSEEILPASLVAPLPSSEQTNLPSSNHTYTKSTPKHIHHHYAPCVTSTHTTHIISSTAPTYAPHCRPWICGQTLPE